ncbi:MAG: hypothetical protein QE278_13665 [Limnobacter sp.]|nr:hypothetical protein [Limnobacter sp.]
MPHGRSAIFAEADPVKAAPATQTEDQSTAGRKRNRSLSIDVESDDDMPSQLAPLSRAKSKTPEADLLAITAPLSSLSPDSSSSLSSTSSSETASPTAAGESVKPPATNCLAAPKTQFAPPPVTTWKGLFDLTARLRNTQITVPAAELKSNLAGVAAPQSTIVSVPRGLGSGQDSGEAASQSAQPSPVKLHMNTVSYPNLANPGHAVENRIGQTAGSAHSIQNALLAALNQDGEQQTIYSFYNPLRDFPSRGDFAQVMELVKQNGGQRGNESSKPKLNIGGFELDLYRDITTNKHAPTVKLWFKKPGSDTEIKSIILTEFTKPASFTQALSKEELISYRSTLKFRRSQTNLTFVSKAGIGRSAALSVYHQLANLIESGTIKNKDQLKEAFYAHIAQGRRDRGVRFLDVAEQRDSIMAALEEMLNSPQT